MNKNKIILSISLLISGNFLTEDVKTVKTSTEVKAADNLKAETSKQNKNPEVVASLTKNLEEAKKAVVTTQKEVNANIYSKEILLQNKKGFVASLKRIANGKTEFMKTHETIAKIFGWAKTAAFFMAAGFVAKKVYDIIVPENDKFDSNEADSLKNNN